MDADETCAWLLELGFTRAIPAQEMGDAVHEPMSLKARILARLLTQLLIYTYTHLLTLMYLYSSTYIRVLILVYLYSWTYAHGLMLMFLCSSSYAHLLIVCSCTHDLSPRDADRNALQLTMMHRS